MSEIKPYDQADGKKEQVRNMFDRIAFRYDFLNRLLSLGIDVGWRKKTVRTVQSDRPFTILDVATGTADLALMLARRIPQARITGVDLSPEMLERGRKKIRKREIANIAALIEADAEALPFPRESFDAVTVGFGVRNFGNIPAGLDEMYRILKPGGHVYVLEFALPEGKIFGSLFLFYFRRLLPFIGGVVSGERKAYRYLQRSVGDFPYGERFSGLLAQAGFCRVTQQLFTRGIAILYRAEKPHENKV
ncbi:MAG: bifunctional demethylmenaquinone methyltransferase/2-methoxy-6-polyprenyl-1,4-benzoquinol methylase UbiE [Rikenellaceae bacterium]|nr:bifunctional demethylmenaquinone methyltransferase/2-methoxy-6-polyprenyl-1,4-benzoquinol methylase UbiE [Rikenellaceae bacterium]